MEPMLGHIESVKKYSAGGQLDLFGSGDSPEDTFTMKPTDEMPRYELLSGEKTGHGNVYIRTSSCLLFKGVLRKRTYAVVRSYRYREKSAA